MTQHDNILIVPVPEGSGCEQIKKDGTLLVYSNAGQGHTFIDLPLGLWRIVGRAKELAEEQWHKIIGGQLKQMPYPDFELVFNWFDTATESGMSLLRSHGIDPETNPLILKREGV